MNFNVNLYSGGDGSDNFSRDWTITKIAGFLRYHEVEEDIIDIFITHQIDGVAFSQLKESDLREMTIKIIGMRKKLLYLIKKWIQCEWRSDYIKQFEVSEKRRAKTISEDPPLSIINSELLFKCNGDYGKLFVSFLYVFIVFGISAFVMVLAHERLPDMTKYPPLPDLILDNLPYISWGFEASEMVAVVLLLLWMCIIACHKYRFVLLRRFFTLIGTVFLLRSVTMIITSLSVPGTHLHGACTSSHPSLHDKLKHALNIWLGFGLSINGVRTCGDYMFSGHTSCLTLLNFFITEYTPRRFYHLHTFTWILNLFGLFFILAAHEHYSIDVFVAFYLSSRLFLYYHWQANNYSLMTRDHQRARIWFPMFTWFESNCPCIIPNQYELPFASLFAHLSSLHRKQNEKSL